MPNDAKRKIEYVTFQVDATGKDTKVDVYTRPPKNHPIYQLVGLVASEFGHMEYVLDEIICELSGTDAHSIACITSQLMGPTPRYNTIIALLTMHAAAYPELKDYIKRVNSLLQRTYEPTDQRNRIIHDPWHIKYKSRQAAQWRGMPRKGLQYGMQKVTRRQMRETLTKIKKLLDEIVALKFELTGAFRALQQKHHAEQPAAPPLWAVTGVLEKRPPPPQSSQA